MDPLDTPTQFNQNSFKTFRATVFTDRTTHKHKNITSMLEVIKTYSPKSKHFRHSKSGNSLFICCKIKNIFKKDFVTSRNKYGEETDR